MIRIQPFGCYNGEPFCILISQSTDGSIIDTKTILLNVLVNNNILNNT